MNTTYRARFDVQTFKGYCLWWVRIRATPKQRWAAAPLSAGRALSHDEAWGMVSRALAGIPVEEVRRESESWAVVRVHIRRPGEARRFEGSIAWEAVEAALGDEGLAQLGLEGAAFRTAFEADLKRREDAKPHFTFEEQLDALAWQAWCSQTGRRDWRRDPGEDLSAFEKWKADKFGLGGDNRQRRSSGPAFDIASLTRTGDLAALGLPHDADAEAIKAAWRRAAMRLHPDRGGDHQQFIRIKAAYERLSEARP